jgi:hypothetical protein
MLSDSRMRDGGIQLGAGIMVVVRCTKKLLKWMDPVSTVEAASTTRLGDWHGNLLFVGHQRLVLFVSQHGRLPVVLPARGIKHIGNVLPVAVAAVLERLGVPSGAVVEEFDAMADEVIACTNDRCVLGTINDFILAIRWRLYEEPWTDLLDLALELSRTPIIPMGTSPDHAVCRLFHADPWYER